LRRNPAAAEDAEELLKRVVYESPAGENGHLFLSRENAREQLAGEKKGRDRRTFIVSALRARNGI
jgi:hypothetical protein